MTFAIGGMETGLYISLLLASALFLVSEKPTAAMFAAALATLTRPDGLILTVLVAIAWLFHHRKIERLTLRAALAVVIPLGIWSLFSMLYFGNVFPETISAKRLAYSYDSSPGKLLQEFLSHGVTGFWGFMGLQGYWGIAASVMHLILFLAGVYALLRKGGTAWVLFVFPVLYVCAFSWGSPFLFQWYAVPPLPFWLITLACGVAFIIRWITEVIGVSAQRGGIIVRELFIAASLIAAAGVQISRFEIQSSHLQPKGIWTLREDVYKQVALDLRGVISADNTVALAEIGAFGFYHPARILDAVGLVSPEALQHYPLHRKYYKWNSAIPASLIRAEEPDYVVAFRDFMKMTLLESPSFLASYQCIKKFPYELWEAPGPWVYERIKNASAEADLVRAKELIEKGYYAEAVQSLRIPLHYSLKTRTDSLELLGIDLLNQLSRISPNETQKASGIFIDFEWDDERSRWLLLDKWGRIFRKENEQLTPFHQVNHLDWDTEAVDLEPSPWGWLVLDTRGNIHLADPGNKPMPEWLNQAELPTLHRAIDLEFSADHQALYILDRRGAVHCRGKVSFNATEMGSPLWDFDIARDIELSKDGKHLYLVEGFGSIKHFGPSEGVITPQKKEYWGFDIVRDLEFTPDGRALVIATGLGSIHFYSESPLQVPSSLPYPEWDYLVDVEFRPDTGILAGLDSNGRVYE